MKVFVNDKAWECEPNTTLAQALQASGVDTPNVAVALNFTVIPKKDWASTLLEENCKIIIIQASHGG